MNPKPGPVQKQIAGLVLALSAALTVAVLYLAQEVLVPLAMASLLAFLLAPVATFFERRRLGRIASVLLVSGVAFCSILGIGYVVGRQVVSLAEDLPKYQDEIASKVKNLQGDGRGFWSKLEKSADAIQKAANEPATQGALADGVVSPAASQVADAPQAIAREQLNASATTVPAAPIGSTPANPVHTVNHEEPASPVATLTAALGLILGPLGTASVIVIFVIFMLLEREALRDRMINLVARGKYTVATRALDDAAGRISRYILAQSIVNGSYGVAIGLGLWLIGVVMGHGTGFPNFVLWGVLCAVLRFVPYIGPWISSIFPAALALAVYPGFGVFLAVFALFMVIELISNNVIEPWLYGASTGLSTMAILVAAVFWTWLWGPVGLLLSTPLTVCLVVMGKHIGPLKFLDTLLGDQPALPPAVSFYQRLLAGDFLDAAKVVKRVDETGTDYSKQADDIYLPALRMTRRDRRDDDLSAEAETRIYGHMLRIALPEVDPAARPAPLPASAPRVLGVPAHHEAEELTLHVLAQAVAPLGVQVDALSTRLLAADVEKQIAAQKPTLLFIAVVPPDGVVQARYLCRRLRRAFPDLPILVGYWGKVRDFDRLLIRLRDSGATYVLTSMAQTVTQIKALIESSEPPRPVPAPPGTTPSTPKVILS